MGFTSACLVPCRCIKCRTLTFLAKRTPWVALPCASTPNSNNDLEQLARSQHRTKSDLAREMLRKRIAVERFRELRRKALPLAEAAGYLSDEEIFRDFS